LFKFTPSFENVAGQEKSKLVQDIINRADAASPKIKERVEESFLPNLEMMGKRAEGWLEGLRNDFSALAENPDDESGGGFYTGWTPEEIKELYSVLYGEELE